MSVPWLIHSLKKLGIKFDVRKVPTDSREDMDAIIEKARAELG